MKDDVVLQWHPCCYMISKLWNIRLYNPEFIPKDVDVAANTDMEG